MIRFVVFTGLLILNINFMFSQDWANLERYRKQNIELGKPEEGEKRIVFMGNSITEGWIVADPEFFSPKTFINRGIGGQTTPQMLHRFQSDVIDLQPKIVLILAGTNDIAGNTGPMTLEEIRDNIIEMTVQAHENNIKVIVCSVLPAYDYSWSPGKQPNIKIPLLNAMLEEYCLKNDIHYLDYFSTMKNEKNGLPKNYALDGVHPTQEGYKVMKRMAKESINLVLEK